MEKGFDVQAVKNGEITVAEHVLQTRIGLCIIRNGSKNDNIEEQKFRLHELPIPKTEDIFERLKRFISKDAEIQKISEKWKSDKQFHEIDNILVEYLEHKQMIQYEKNLVEMRRDNLSVPHVMPKLKIRGINPSANMLSKVYVLLDAEIRIVDLSIKRLEIIGEMLLIDKWFDI